MSSQTPAWNFDPARNEYYYYDATTQLYVYQSGLKVGVANIATSGTGTTSSYPTAGSSSHQVDSNTPRYLTDTDQLAQQLAYTNLNQTNTSGQYYSHSTDVTPRPSAAQLSNYPQQTYSTANPQVSRGTQEATSYHVYQASAQNPYGSHQTSTAAGNYESANQQPSNWLIPGNSANAAAVTDPALLGQFGPGWSASGLVKGNVYQQRDLDPRFQLRFNASEFFAVGKIVKILWPELMGRTEHGMTMLTSASRFPRERIGAKIRWFVVVRQGHGCCSCLPITTYSRQGVAKRGVVKSEHAIIYTSREPPAPSLSEMAQGNERGMLASIRAKAHSKQEKLDSMSRINFGKIYTVEHNVKVYDFGDVHKHHIHLLEEQWRIVFFSRSNNMQNPSGGADDNDEDDGAANDDDDDDDSGGGDDDDQS